MLALLIVSAYSNTFKASWQFDDKPNILNNERLHIEDLSPDTLWKTFFAMPGRDKWYRPLANLSFALNWYVGQDNPFGYHVVNISIHVLTAFLLFLATTLILNTPRLKNNYTPKEVGRIALMSSLLWALNPIQTQAVTYIVQRMASLAGMMVILSIYCYLKARLSLDRRRRGMYFAGCLFSFILAMMAKENAAMLPFSLLLVEIVFFRQDNALENFKKKIPLLLASLIILLIPVVLLAMQSRIQFFTAGYETRPFSLAERLLTEPRILWFYLSQILYPLPSRLSLTHDVVLSTSILSPWTTLAAIAALAASMALAIVSMRRRPLLAFALLFFFLNHVVESSFIALELIFEHRNYIPSFFLFLPIAAGVQVLLNRYHQKNRLVSFLLVGMVGVVIVGMGCFTYLRNQVWRTEASLWRDAMQKAPMDARPVCNLAIQMGWDEHPTPLKYDAALALFKKALALNTARDFLKQEIVANIGGIYFEKGEFREAVPYFNRALQMNPLFLKARYNLIDTLIMLGQWDEASRQADILLNNPKGFFKPEYFNRKGFILLWQKHPEASLPFFKKAIDMGPENPDAVRLNLGVAYSLSGMHQKAEVMFKEAFKTSSNDIRLHFALIENSVRAKRPADTTAYLDRLFSTFSLQTVLAGLDRFSENFRTAPMTTELIIPALRRKLLQTADDFDTREHHQDIQ